jgi:chain length determinant protein EpsF
MTFSQLMRVLIARYRIILLSVFILLVAALALSLLLPKKYTATASIYLDVRSPDAIHGLVNPTMATASYMSTQVDILFSQAVALKVVKMLKLDQNAAARESFMESTGGQGQIDPWLAGLLRRYLEVRPSRDSNVMDISYTAVDPRFAMIVANAFAQAYIDTNVRLRVEPAKQFNSWFDQQIKEQRDKYEAAQQRLSEFQRKSGIITSDERLDVENARLNELSNQLVLMQAQSADSSSRQRQIGASSAESLPEVLSNPLIQGLKADVAHQEAEVQRLGAQLGPNHPQFQRAQTQLSSQRAELKTEVAKVVGGIRANNELSQRREGQLRSELEAQRQKVLSMKTQRDQLAVLQRDVDSAQRAYDDIATRVTQTALESQANQTNIHLLNPAVEPNSQSQPKLWLNLAIALVAGGMLGTGLALWRESSDRRIRSRDDLGAVLGAPTLITLTRERVKSRFLPAMPRLLSWRSSPAQ